MSLGFSRATVGHRGKVAVGIVAGVGLCLTGLAPLGPASAAEPLVTNPAQYVNTLAGTAGSTNNFPGPALPFGMVQFSPDSHSGNTTQGAGNNGYRQKGYQYGDTVIRGFGMTHASQGCGMGGDFPILPTAYDRLDGTGNTNHPYAQRDVITGERATTETTIPGYYRVPLRDTSISASAGINIIAELTATARGGIGRFTFPADTVRPKVFLKANQSSWSNPSVNSEVHVDPDTGIVTARALAGNFCRKGETHNLYYALAFDQPWTTFGTWADSGQAVEGRTDAAYAGTSYRETGAYFVFPDGAETIQARVAISYTSAEKAVLNLQTEIPTLNATTFDTVKQAAWDRWNAELSKVKVSAPVAGQSDRDLRTFYTALYHSITHPATMSDVDGTYIGFETTPQIHNVSAHPGAGGRTRVQYTMISDWDTYRCLVPFQAALWPEQTADQVQSLVNAAEQMGSYPQWTVANGSTNQMNGDNVAPLIAFAYAFGARDFDQLQALHYLVEGAVGETADTFTGGTNRTLGNVNYPMIQRPGAQVYNQYKYAPQIRAFQADHMVTGGSYTLEYALDDLSVSEFAKALGQNQTAAQFLERSHYWQNLFNPTTGSISPRDINGMFPEGNPNALIAQTFGYRGNVWEQNVGQQGFEEGSAEQYLWLVPQNLAGLFDALGGKERAEARLDAFMGNNFRGGASFGATGMNLDNEPNFQVPWIYNYLGAPDKTSKAVDKATQTLFGYLPNNAEPGNDDLGALANWFVWSALGMYPMTPGTGVLALNAPMFDRSVVELGNGRTVTINAEGAQSPTRAWDSENKYIAGMRLNGGPTTKNWIEYSDLTAGATIDYEIVTDTVPAWGTADADLPPSWRGGNGIVANVTPEAGPVTGALSVAPGGTVGGTLDVQRIDSSVTTFTATIVTSHPGIVADEVAPASIDEHGFGTTPISFAVDAGVASGYYSATVTARAGTATYAKDLIIRVAKPGSLEAAKTIIGTSTRQATKGSFDGGNGYGSPGAQGFGINEGATEVNTYSRDELAKIGFTPGSVHTYEAGDIELTFEWPTAPAGYPDAYAPDGQTITLDSPTTALSFIGAAHNGRTVYRGDGATGTATVHLWDGTAATTATADLSFGHWLRPSAEGTEAGGHLEPNHGNTKVAWLAHRNPLEREYNSGAANNIEGSYLFGTIPYAAPAGSVITAVTFPTAATVRVFAIAHSGRTIGVGETVSNVATGFVPVTATGFASGEDVTVSIDTAPVSTTVVQADDFGAIDARAAIAPGVAPGAYTVTLTAYSYPDAEALSAPVQVDTLASTRTREAAGAIVGTYALPEGAVERYTPDSYAVLAAALADARGLLALSDPISAESITAVLAALETATAGLVDAVDMSPLTQLIAAAQAVIANPDGYVAQNMPALIAAVAQAQLKAADPDITQEEICVVALQLTRAMASVHPKGDKAPLVALLRFVVALDSSRYTPASWEGVDIAIAVADGVVANEQVSIDDVEEAFTALVDAVGGLTLRAAKAGLGSVIVVAETIIAEADLYVPASLVGLSVALTTAQAVFADPNAAAADVSAVRQALVAQIALARLRPASSPDSSSIEVLASVASAGDVTPSAVPPAVEPVGGSVAPPATAAGSALAPAPAAPIAKKAFRSAAKPVVSGTAKVGRKLVVKTGGWSPKPKLSYQWYRNGKAIAKATKVTYRLTAKDKGKRISVKVTAKKAGYRTLVKASAKTSRIA